MSRTGRIVRRATGLVAWGIVAVCVATVLVAVVVPRLAGAAPYTVLTGSMQPDLPPGTLVVVRPSDDIALGDVVTYQRTSGVATTVTHRVVAQTVDATGETAYITRGDANGADDPEPVRAVQIRGELWYAVPHLGRLTQVVSSGQRETALTIAVAALLLYAAAMTVGAVRDHRRERVR